MRYTFDFKLVKKHMPWRFLYLFLLFILNMALNLNGFMVQTYTRMEVDILKNNIEWHHYFVKPYAPIIILAQRNINCCLDLRYRRIKVKQGTSLHSSTFEMGSPRRVVLCRICRQHFLIEKKRTSPPRFDRSKVINLMVKMNHSLYMIRAVLGLKWTWLQLRLRIKSKNWDACPITPKKGPISIAIVMIPDEQMAQSNRKENVYSSPC